MNLLMDKMGYSINYSHMMAILSLIVLIVHGCISTYIPESSENRELVVVQGLITDGEKPDTIKLFRSFPLGKLHSAIPVTGCDVKVRDNLGREYVLVEIFPGVHITPETFKGRVGLTYKLLISDRNNTHYESDPVEMRPVPVIDSLYYEKVNTDKPAGFYKGIDACKIYIDTHDPSGNCKYFRWDFSETWMFRLNFSVPDSICYINNNSHDIDIKSTAAFDKSTINRHLIKYITNETDRLKIRYSILVNQYSLNEEEYAYWEKMDNILSNVGGLYDMIPASLPNNLHCIENPDETVLGYFSVSSKSSERMFISDRFEGIIDRYSSCITATIYTKNPPGLNESIWILLTNPCSMPCQTSYMITNRRECADCTLRGTKRKPDFWTDK